MPIFCVRDHPIAIRAPNTDLTYSANDHVLRLASDDDSPETFIADVCNTKDHSDGTKLSLLNLLFSRSASIFESGKPDAMKTQLCQFGNRLVGNLDVFNESAILAVA